MSTALLAASQTLQAVLLAALQGDGILSVLFPPLGPSVVSLATPDGMVDQDQTGVSVWLYRVVRDEQLLNRPPSRLPPDRLRPPPLPMRLHYLMTPMMRGNAGEPAPETDQHVLGAVLRSFHQQPILAGAALAGALRGTDRQISVRLESPGLEELARVWDTLDQPYRASLCYEVSVVEVESEQPDAHGPPVLRSEPELGQARPLLLEGALP
ncbi:MAG: Pvc16 family protein [Tistlia sp.]|uniref:Pvc16 family protein n=1 Tax=Tistlia sp. TaxID=3057121 RepID=UPI0034A192BA